MSFSREEDYDALDWVGGKIERAFLEVVIITLWNVLNALVGPLGRFLAFFLWSGQWIYAMSRGFVRLLRQVFHWLSASLGTTRFGGWEFRRYHAAFGVVVAVSVATAILRRIFERFNEFVRRKREVRERMANSQSYDEWSRHSLKLRSLEASSRDKKIIQKRAQLYDNRLLDRKLMHLRKVFENRDAREIVMALRADLVRKLGNMTDSQIYQYPEIPAPIRDYINEVKLQLEFITEEEQPDFGLNEKLNFLQETRHTFGKTALLLSGGGALGAFHLGVVKALLENDLLPRIVGGSSVGSIVSAIVGTHTDEELVYLFDHLEEVDMGFLSNSTIRQFLAQLLTKGHLQDEVYLQERLRNLLGESTFLEAYEKTGRVLNVVVCAADTNEPPRVMNYLTAPQVVVWSAVAASSAFPGLFPAQDIKARNTKGETVSFSVQAAFGGERRWRDGSLEEDLPFEVLREMFNVNYFLVSQTNPHIVPILNFKNQFNRKIANMIEIEWKHRCQQLQNLLPDWIPSKWLTLFSQTWEGDVTMVLPATSYWTLRKAIVNPSTLEVLQATHRGEVATWEKLSAIQVNCAIEKALDQCHSLVASRLKKQHSLGGMRSRIPSWLHMPVLGMPSVESLESLLDLEDGNAPATPKREADRRTDGQMQPDCLDETALSASGSLSVNLDTLGDKGLDVIAP